MDRLPRRTMPTGGEGQGPVFGMPFNDPGIPGDVPRYGPGASPGYENPYGMLPDFFSPEEWNAMDIGERKRIIKVLAAPWDDSPGPLGQPEGVPDPALSLHATPLPRPQPTPTGTSPSMMQRFLDRR